ncbi:MAG: FkbM family methyltransferase [Clostridia bacterium]|nr:FkbM family methyltransferase [Clostridia bacterium]MDD4686355.1 FkbM family methyltransferase [Clostridia bacterium]
MSIRSNIKGAFRYLKMRLSTKHDICRKISLQNKNDVWELSNGVKFYLPNFPYDLISKHIVFYNNFFELEILNSLDKYIPENAVILDIGANIGNHSVYWASRGAKHIHSFEPILHTYNNLVKNISVNEMEKIIIPYNIGLGDAKSLGEIEKNNSTNIGGTKIKESNVSSRYSIKIERLDDIDLKEEKIDFVKIDVEYFEPKTLAGMQETIKKYKPSIFIEVFGRNRRFVKKFLINLGYRKPIKYESSNYLFLPK